MKKEILFVFISWIVAGGYSQAKPIDSDNWNTGKIELASGKQIEGKLCYNWVAEILEVKRFDGTLKAYSALQVNRFMYFDNEHNVLRTFVSVKFPVTPTRSHPIFLEVYITGPLTVYRRLRHQHEFIPIAKPAKFGTDEQLYDNLDDFMYYVFDNGSIIDLTFFAHDLWPRLETEFGDQLNQYRIEQSLDLNATLSRLMLIAHYNILKTNTLATVVPTEFKFGDGQ